MSMISKLADFKIFFDEKLLEAIEPLKENPLYEGLEYCLFGKGKRLRPYFLYLSYRMSGGSDEAYLPFALALELIHNYSLVHDDMPCMDNDTIRHGKPSVFAKFGESMALLIGDALLNLAYSLLFHEIVGTCIEKTAKASYEISCCAGISGMIKGQVYDTNGQKKSEQDTLRLYELKTSRLFQAALVAGGILSNANDAQIIALKDCGKNFGIAFQLQDDFLDYSQSSQKTSTEPNFYRDFGEENADFKKKSFSQKAIENLDIFGEAASPLMDLIASLLFRSV